MAKKDSKALIEALLFVSGKPLSADLLGELSGMDRKTLQEHLAEMADEYESGPRGFRLAEVAGGYQLRSKEEFADSIGRLFQKKSRRRFSRSGLETLAIVAYRQPVTRAEVEQIRGVDSGGVLKTLLAQEVIRILGRKEAPGRPMLYGTTREFLEYFGLRDLESLPTLKEVTDLLEEGEVARAAIIDDASGMENSEPGKQHAAENEGENEDLEETEAGQEEGSG